MMLASEEIQCIKKKTSSNDLKCPSKPCLIVAGSEGGSCLAIAYPWCMQACHRGYRAVKNCLGKKTEGDCALLPHGCPTGIRW